MKSLFSIRGQMSNKTQATLEVVGVFSLIALWYAISSVGLAPEGLLPSPLSVVSSVPELHFKDALIRNLGYSMKLNLLGYLEAVAICVPIGFVIGLFPFFKGMLNKQVDAIRFIPLTAVTGLFIAWFGIDDLMKVQFLAFGIIVYLLPVVVQRIAEVDDVYQQTAFTLGASKYQMIKTVFLPAVLSKLFDDIRVLVAISWTYIIVAEMINKTGGVGGMLYTAARQSRIDKVFAILFVIIVVGFIQDKLFKITDKKLFPYKDVK